jgi:hypothetical protein
MSVKLWMGRQTSVVIRKEIRSDVLHSESSKLLITVNVFLRHMYYLKSIFSGWVVSEEKYFDH